MRPTLVLRIHPSPVLIPQMYSGMTLRHPSDAATHAYWDEARRLEYEGLWKKGEWKEVAKRGVKLDMVRFSLSISTAHKPLPSSYPSPNFHLVWANIHFSSFLIPSPSITEPYSIALFSLYTLPSLVRLNLFHLPPYLYLPPVAKLTTRNPESKLWSTPLSFDPLPKLKLKLVLPKTILPPN